MNLQESAEIQCPYCGEQITLLIDCSAGAQQYVEDCQVCCQPMLVCIAIGEEGDLQVEAHRDDE
jgi:hypothetical protein